MSDWNAPDVFFVTFRDSVVALVVRSSFPVLFDTSSDDLPGWPVEFSGRACILRSPGVCARHRDGLGKLTWARSSGLNPIDLAGRTCVTMRVRALAEDLMSSWDSIRRAGLTAGYDRLDDLTVLDASVIIGRLLNQCRSALAARKLEVTAAVWGLERLMDSADSVPLVDSGDVELVSGVRNVQRVLADVTATTTLFSLLREPLPAGRTVSVLHDLALAARGVSVRSVYCGQDTAPSPEQVRHMRLMADAGVEVRLASLVPTNLVIVDQESVILPADPDRPADALVVVRGSAWACLADLIFQDTWQSAAGARVTDRLP